MSHVTSGLRVGDDHLSPRNVSQRLVVACAGLAVLAWALLVARDQYRVESLQDHQFALDALFLSAVLVGVIAYATVLYGTRAVLIRVTLVSASIAVALAAAEGAARFVFRHAHSSGNMGDYIAQHGGGPALRVNSLGFRDREVPPKRPDRYRIVVIGDSFTWGSGIETEERYSNLLGRFLGPTYEVINFGTPAEDMPGHLTALTRAMQIAPDFVLLQLFINDFETDDMHRPVTYPLLPPQLDRQLMRSSLFYQLLDGEWSHVQGLVGEWYSYPAYMARNLRDPNLPASRLTSAELRSFFERARDAHIGVGAVLFPAANEMGRYGSRYPFGYLHERVESICDAEHVPCLDLLPSFSKIRDPRTMFVSPFDAHPNAMANRRAAYEMMARFGDVWHARDHGDGAN